MIDYSKWPRRSFLVTSLKLDDYNPRLPTIETGKTLTQPQIIDYLVDKEDVYELAKKIATKGYFINEEPIVCKIGDKYIVLEGNRRVAACKILINPDLIKSGTKKRNITELLKKFDINLIKKLEVRISPDRETSDIVIVNRHTDGTAIEKWDKTKQDRFFYNRFQDGESIDDLAEKFGFTKGTIKEALIRYNIFQELVRIESLSAEEKKAVEDETKFSMTNVERFYKSKLGKEFLGVDFDGTGNILHMLPRVEYTKRLKQITTDVINNKLNSRIYGNEMQQQEYVKALYSSNDFRQDFKPAKTYQIEYENKIESDIEEEQEDGTKEVKTPKAERMTPRNKLIPTDLKWKTGIDRIDRIFKEIKAANLDQQFNGTAVLFRSYLDMIVYQYLIKNEGIKELMKQEHQKRTEDNEKRLEKTKKFIFDLGVTEFDETKLGKIINVNSGISKDWVPSLKHMLSFLSKNDTLLPDVKLRQALASYVSGSNDYLDHSDFNLLVHNEYYLKHGDDLKIVWDQLKPILEYINQHISK
jgi:hypothetical protein